MTHGQLLLLFRLEPKHRNGLKSVASMNNIYIYCMLYAVCCVPKHILLSIYYPFGCENDINVTLETHQGRKMDSFQIDTRIEIRYLPSLTCHASDIFILFLLPRFDIFRNGMSHRSSLFACRCQSEPVVAHQYWSIGMDRRIYIFNILTGSMADRRMFRPAYTIFHRRRNLFRRRLKKRDGQIVNISVSIQNE